MAENRPILVSGNALKKEKSLVSGTAVPATFVIVSGAGVVAAPAGSGAQVAVVDYTSVNGVNFTNANYVANDQIPVRYPTNGCEINVLVDPASAAVAVGDNIGIGAGGKARKAVAEVVVEDVVTVEGDAVIGVALEAVANPATGGKILVEVLK